ncbi:response regulator transcription factor [Patescibacteria group bacterium]|nr:response regulator transcription factor [Patescibacteria group bacterium]
MKILLIEDDRHIAKIIGMGLRFEGFEVDYCYDGKTALKMASASKYDCILLDLLLPEKNGDEVCKNLRNADFNVPIIAITALADLNSKMKLFNLGADDYLTKPFELQELVARIKAALRKQNAQISSVLSYDDIRLDLNKRQAARRGKVVDLRDKELKILEYLMRHAEQVLTREMILNYAWGPSVERITNVVDVHVHNLREKIDKPFNAKTLRTVNSVGYKLYKDPAKK